MSNIQERLDSLRTLIQTPDFLSGKGLSNEVNIRIFCYDPADEMAVQHFVAQLKADRTLQCNLVESNLYETFLSICEELDIMDGIQEMEEEDGPDYLLEQLRTAISEKDYVEKIQYSPQNPGDVLLITGVGDVFPFMRVHSLLEALQPHFSGIPILVMYPGVFTGYYLKLFDRLQPNDYYRAFKII